MINISKHGCIKAVLARMIVVDAVVNKTVF